MVQYDPDEDLRLIVVLVVEDEPLLRMLLAEDLRDAGFAVVEAASGDEALTWFLAHQNIDLIFTDVQMPGMIDGLQLLQQVRKVNPLLPVIVTSGAIGRESVDREARFIPKPYRLDEVRALVFSTLGLDPQGTE